MVSKALLLAGVVTMAMFMPGVLAKSTEADTKSTDTQKNSNIDAAQKLNGADRTASGGTAENAKDSNSDIPQGKPIHGFHPIKKALAPLNNLEAMSIKLEQQIMKLEGPIAALQPPMQKLQTGMSGVSDRLSDTQSRLNGLNTQVVEVRSDLHAMQKDISALTKPIVELQGPLATVEKPLEAVEVRLNLIILAILAAAALISIGTPLAAIYVVKNRAKLLAPAKPKQPQLTGAR